CGGGGGSATLNAQDTSVVSQATGTIAFNAQAAALCALDEQAGKVCDPSSLHDSVDPVVSIQHVLNVLQDEKADTVIKSDLTVGVTNTSGDVTVATYLADLANDVQTIWPEEVPQIDRVRESLAK